MCKPIWIAVNSVFHYLKSMTSVYLFALILAILPFQQGLCATEAASEAPTSQNENTKHQQILYSLLVAELAAQRGMQNLALQKYLEVAELTQDPAIAKVATEWTIEFQAPEEALSAAKLWATLAQDDLQAQMVAATLYIGQSIQQAIPFLSRAVELDPKEFGQHIISVQARLSTRSAEHLKMALFRIASTKDKDPYAQLAAALSAAQQEDIENAKRLVNAALALSPDLTAALQLKARLIRFEDENDTRALQFLKETVAKFPRNAELRLFYASALLDSNQFKEAIPHFKQLTEDDVYGGQALLFLGEIYTKEKDYKRSREALEKALDHKDSAAKAQFLLGELAQTQGNHEEALKWYGKIESGVFHVPAILRAAKLLKEDKKYEEAIKRLHEASPSTLEDQKQLLLAEIDLLMLNNKAHDALFLAEEVLTKIPTDEDMLLAHSLVAIKLKNYTLAEKDLVSILKDNPNNAEALNTLGYILSLQPGRLEEAKPYLEQALSLSPNNPAYLDSIGWLYFRLGEETKALSYLKRAKELSSDPEIAAHYGEVLWSIGKKEEAKAIWNAAHSKTPENEILRETMSRFQIDIKPLNMGTSSRKR